MSAALRCAPWIKRALTADERAEVYALADDLTVYLWPSAQWRGRTWFARISRGDIAIAETAGHPDAMTAFRQARDIVAFREGRAA